MMMRRKMRRSVSLRVDQKTKKQSSLNVEVNQSRGGSDINTRTVSAETRVSTRNQKFRSLDCKNHQDLNHNNTDDEDKLPSVT